MEIADAMSRLPREESEEQPKTNVPTIHAMRTREAKQANDPGETDTASQQEEYPVAIVGGVETTRTVGDLQRG